MENKYNQMTLFESLVTFISNCQLIGIVQPDVLAYNPPVHQ
jgi:hypothetical protein